MAAVEKAAVAVAAVASESAASAVTEADTTAAAEATTETVEKSEKAEQRSHACFVLGEMARRRGHCREPLASRRWGRVAWAAVVKVRAATAAAEEEAVTDTRAAAMAKEDEAKGKAEGEKSVASA